jgi:hypothetical protein
MKGISILVAPVHVKDTFLVDRKEAANTSGQLSTKPLRQSSPSTSRLRLPAARSRTLLKALLQLASYGFPIQGALSLYSLALVES